jgi:hypothetical protein
MFEENVGPVLVFEDLPHPPANRLEFLKKTARHVADCSEVFDRQHQQITFYDLAYRRNYSEVVRPKEEATLGVSIVNFGERTVGAPREFAAKVAITYSHWTA